MQSKVTDYFMITHDIQDTYKIFQCEKCNLHIHGYDQYTQRDKKCEKIICDVCKKTFGSQKSFRKHLKNCPPKRFSCDICHKSYSQKSDAISHQKKTCKSTIPS